MRSGLGRGRVFGVLAILAMAGAVDVQAGSDLDVFIAGQSVQPNVLILFDNSGSMADGIPYDPSFTYSGSSVPTTVYDRCKTFNPSPGCTCSSARTRRRR